MLSRSDLSSFVMSLFQFGEGVSWGGQSMFFFLCCGFVFGLVWFSIRSRCRSLSLIENHTQVVFSHLCFVGDYFLFCVFRHLTELFRVSFHSPCYFVQCSEFIHIIMNTFHAALWSSPSSNTDDRYRCSFEQHEMERSNNTVHSESTQTP